MTALESFLPLLILGIGSLLFLVFGKVLTKYRLESVLATTLIAATGYCTLMMSNSVIDGAEASIWIDGFSKLLGVVLCAGGILTVVLNDQVVSKEQLVDRSEYYYLLLASLAGALLMVFAADYLTMFIGLEVMSLSLYCLCGGRLKQRSSSEAGLKYFLLGCFSSAFFLYGIALWYGATGSLSLSGSIGELSGSPELLIVSFLFLLVGIGFKLGLTPFHYWVPDVYQGSPTSVVTFMSYAVKVAGVGALLKIVIISFGVLQAWAIAPLWIVSILAMCVGNVAALQQQDIRRMLAYSSVAQAGYMLIGVITSGGSPEGVVAALFYLVSYCAMSIGAFGVLSVIGPSIARVSDLKGLGRRQPFLGVVMTLFFLGLAGLPPSLAGFVGKVYLFTAGLSEGYYGLVIIAAINSAISCAYYCRIPYALFFQSEETESGSEILLSFATRASLTMCAFLVVMIGIAPDSLVLAAQEAATALLIW